MLPILHLIFVAAWGGLVLTEAAIEIAGARRRELAPAVAELHYWVDVLVEAPILAGVLVTGGLILRGRPVDTALAAKIACGLAAVAANAACIYFVIRRRGGRPTTRAIFMTAAFGMPCAIVAAAIGLSRVL